MTRTDRRTAGFTLVETLVALAVLTVGLVASYAAAVSSAGLASSIRSTMIASNLAQEGVEIVRSIRDSNWFIDKAFDTGLVRGEYEVAIYSQALATPYQGRPLYVTAEGLYQYASDRDSVLTPFRRKVTISPASAEELVITCEVTWTDRGRDRSIAVESHVYDWK